MAVPAVNCLRVSDEMTFEQAALVEPLGCVLHSSDRVERARGRYNFDGDEHIRNVLICGAGPAGLLFLQYLRNVKRFEGLVLVSDVPEKNLEFTEQFGGTPINVRRHPLPQAVIEHTRGERIHYLIEACGNSQIFEQMPGILRKQATVLLYGHGHRGRDIGLLGNILFLEPTLVAAVGASRGFHPGRRPQTYRRPTALIGSGKILVEPFVTHRYHALDDIHRAFETDFAPPEYIK